MTDLSTNVLIVGAGPSGSTLARILARHHIDFIIIEKNESSTLLSKATGLHVSSMRLLNQLGLGEEILPHSQRLDRLLQIKNGEELGEVLFVQGDEEYAKNYSISQKSLENILHNGIPAERMMFNCSFTRFIKVDENSCEAEVENISTKKKFTISASFVVGADGFQSSVRKSAEIGFEIKKGKKKSLSFDAQLVEFTGSRNDVLFFASEYGSLALVPIGTDTFKISGPAPNEGETLSETVLNRSGLAIDEETVTGEVTYFIKSGVADKFHNEFENILLIGDAGHVFYPTGGYGMNVGIGDAFRISWILAGIINGQLKKNALQSYYEDRQAYAQTVKDDATKKLKEKAPETKVETTHETQVKETYLEGFFVGEEVFQHFQSIEKLEKEALSQLRVELESSYGFKVLLSTNQENTDVSIVDEFVAELQGVLGFDVTKIVASGSKSNSIVFLTSDLIGFVVGGNDTLIKDLVFEAASRVDRIFFTEIAQKFK